MKTINIEAILDEAKNRHNIGVAWQLSKHIILEAMRDVVRLTQEWIDVDEEIECNINIDGIMYSENVLLKVKDFEFPLVGCYMRANDDEFWEIYGDFKVNQKDITHYRFIEFK